MSRPGRSKGSLAPKPNPDWAVRLQRVVSRHGPKMANRSAGPIGRCHHGSSRPIASGGVEHIRLTRIQLAFDPADDPITRQHDRDRTPPLAAAGSLAGSVACLQGYDGDPRTVRMVRLERDSAELRPLAKSSTQPIRIFLLRTGSGHPAPGIDHPGRGLSRPSLQAGRLGQATRASRQGPKKCADTRK